MDRDVIEVVFFGILSYVVIPLIYHYIISFILKKYSEHTDTSVDNIVDLDIVAIYVVIYLLSRFSPLEAYLDFALVPIIVSVILIMLAPFINSFKFLLT